MVNRLCTGCGGSIDELENPSVTLDMDPVSRLSDELCTGSESIHWEKGSTTIHLCMGCAEEYGALDVYRRISEQNTDDE